MKAEITIKSVGALGVGEFISDTQITGFIARRLPSGKVTFGYQYTVRPGVRPWLKLGILGDVTVKEARDSAKINAGKVASGSDPAAEKRVKTAKSGNTVNHVLTEWLLHHARGPEKLRSADQAEKTFNRHVRKAIGTIAIYDLTRKDIIAMLDAITSTAGAVMADRTLAYVRAAFNWWRIRDDNFITMPIVKGMARTSTKRRQGTRMLSIEELCDVWRGSDEIGTDAPACFPAFVKALILLGCRRTEVARMHSREFGLGNRINDWTIPADRYKTKKDHLLPLPDAVRALLPVQSDGYVFSSDGGKTALGGFGNATEALKRAVAALRKREGRPPMPKWTFHDLRRTARSTMPKMEIGVPDLHAKAVLGHVIQGVDGIYNVNDFYDEKTAALAKWAAFVINAVEQARAANNPRRSGCG